MSKWLFWFQTTQTHMCRYCNYTTGKRYLLSRHMKSHSEERPHKCSVCERGFKTLASLQVTPQYHQNWLSLVHTSFTNQEKWFDLFLVSEPCEHSHGNKTSQVQVLWFLIYNLRWTHSSCQVNTYTPHDFSCVDHFFILQHEDLGNNYNLYFDHFDPYFYNPSVVKEFLAPLKSKNSWHDTDRIKICKLGQLFFGWRFYMYTRLRHGTKGPKGASTPIPAELWAFCQAPWFDS